MTIKRAELERAAFWDQDVCLACGQRQPHESSDPSECVECGSEDLLPAKRILEIEAFVEDEE